MIAAPRFAAALAHGRNSWARVECVHVAGQQDPNRPDRGRPRSEVRAQTRARIFFNNFSAHAETERGGARSDRRVVSERSRLDAS